MARVRFDGMSGPFHSATPPAKAAPVSTGRKGRIAVPSPIREIEASISLLIDGWNERIEYKVKVAGDVEKRVNAVKMPGLIEQLRTFTEEGDAGPDDGAQRGSPNKGGSRPPGRVQGFLLLDEITVEATILADRALEASLLDRTYALRPLRGLLADVILLEARRLNDTDTQHPLVDEIAETTRKWVRDARRLLSHEPGTSMFDGKVCGECGGALAVARDASTAVRCVGIPATASCGKRYERDNHLALYLEVYDAQQEAAD